VAILAFAAVFTTVGLTGAARGGFRIDEAHKLSETPFFGLWMNGQWHHPAWFADLVDRTNPPVGKYAFGAAIRATGQQLPSLPTLGARSVDHYVPPLHPPEVAEPYRPYLPAARRVSTLATALFAALIAWSAARTNGVIAAAIASLLLLTNYATQLLWATAVFDPLLVLFVTLMLPLAMLATKRRAMLITSLALLGIVGAFAFQTRLNGLLFFAITFVIVAVYALLRGFRRELLIGTIASSILFAGVTLLLNPYYWSRPVASTSTTEFAGDRTLLTPAHRLQLQLRDARVLLETPHVKGAALHSVSERTRFLVEIVFGDLAGLFLFLGSALGLIELALRWRAHDDAYRLAAIWCAASAMLFVVSLPLAWPRYLLVVVPPLSYLAGNGYSAVLSMLGRARKKAV
jgi:4-amino-4-deoxy-L-arabinose transferase-like glycosyltransferase